MIVIKIIRTVYNNNYSTTTTTSTNNNGNKILHLFFFVQACHDLSFQCLVIYKGICF